MDTRVCPYLGTLDEENNQRPSIDYPCFENHCFAEIVPAEHTLMLADQATYCLSGGYALCPRYQNVQAAQLAHVTDTPYPSARTAYASATPFPGGVDITTSLPLDSELLHLDLTQPATGSDYTEDYTAEARERRTPRASWMLALVAFIGVFACGIAVSAYTGWQMVRGDGFAALAMRNNVSRNAGESGPESQENMSTVVPTATPAQVVIVVTAAAPAEPQSEKSAGSENPSPGAQANPGTGAASPTFQFPAAVTPTPVVVNPADAQRALPAPPSASGPDVAQSPPPGLDVNGIVPLPPTRRPTPDFLIPTSTDAPAATPTATPSPTATWPPPVILFGPDDKELLEGKCTTVRWTVENVRAVYYENLSVEGDGEREECIDNHDETYALTVVLPNGGTEIYTTTVALIPPTLTPTPTYTYTPEPEPTPTWTPDPPTPTPTPDYVLGTTLVTASGDTTYTCQAGEPCEIGLLATNTGNVADTIRIVVMEYGLWSLQLCRQDGVCSDKSLAFTDMGPGSTALVTVRLDIPGGAAPQTVSYAFRSQSDRSNQAVMSDTISLQVTVPESVD